MILTIAAEDLQIVAYDLADPDDLSGGDHDYVFLDRLPQGLPNLADCLRARVLGRVGSIDDLLVLEVDTSTGEFLAHFTPTTGD